MIGKHMPHWARLSDAKDDAFQDVWQERMDPDNYRGEVVTAFYVRYLAELDDDDGSVYIRNKRHLQGVNVMNEYYSFHMDRNELSALGFNVGAFDKVEESD